MEPMSETCLDEEPIAETSPACGRCLTRLHIGELRCPVCGKGAAPRALAEVEGMRATVIRCTSCRAAVTYSVKEQALHCPYCGEIAEVETPEDPSDAVQAYLPFTVQPAQVHEALKQFFSKARWYHRGDVATCATIDSLRALWWPAWVCKAQALYSWTADTDAGAQESDWAPHAGQLASQIEGFCVSASRGLTSKETKALLPSYRLDTRRPSPEGPEGAVVECFELPRSRARQKLLRHIDAHGKAVVRRALPGHFSRNLDVVSSLQGLQTLNLALPAYVLAYRYGKTLYRVVFSGQDVAVSTGELPVVSVVSASNVLLKAAIAVGAIACAAALLSQLF